MKHEVHVYDDPNENLEDDLRPEYDFDYSKARPNSYAARAMRQRAIVLEKDFAEVFTTSEQVNKALRAILEAVPVRPHQDKSAQENAA